MKLLHRFFAVYYSVLIEDCLDEEMKCVLLDKLHHHEQQIKKRLV